MGKAKRIAAGLGVAGLLAGAGGYMAGSAAVSAASPRAAVVHVVADSGNSGVYYHT